MSYTIRTDASWSKTMRELSESFSKWSVTDWDTNYPRGARLEGMNQSETDRTVTLRYVLKGKTVNLSMSRQSRAVDNLRMLFLAVEAMRMNEKRGIGELIAQTYLQLAGPIQEKSPWEVLGIYPGSPLSVAEAAYKERAMIAHPDRGGSELEMKQLNNAIKIIRETT